MEFIRGLQTRFGQGGNIGGIPPEYVAQKYETTCLYEPEDLLDSHWRAALKDNTCEPPSLESDQPRYDHGARNLLNVIYEGSRSKVKPDHPEIYIANTEPDPRGCQTMPNMRLKKEAEEERIRRYTDFRSTATSDQSVDSGVWGQHAINQAMRSTWPGLKARERWFDRSLSARPPGISQLPTTVRGSALTYMQSDEDKNHVLSEMPSQLFTPGEVVLGRGKKPVIIGPRHVPTHVFGVARFGSAPRSFNYKYDASKNQEKAVPTADFMRSEEATLRNLAIVMAGESGCPPREANPTTSFNRSAEGMTTRHVGHHGNTRRALDSMEHTQRIVETLVAQTEHKRARDHQACDMANRRLHRIIDEDMYSDATLSEHMSIRLIDDPFSVALRKRNQLTEIDVDPKSGLAIPIYSQAHLPTIDEIRRARGNTWIEPDVDESKTVHRGKSNLRVEPAHDKVAAAKTLDETIFTDSDVAARLIGPIGDKSRIREHLRFEPRHGLGDINSQPQTYAKGAPHVVSRRVTTSSYEPDIDPIHRDFESSRL